MSLADKNINEHGDPNKGEDLKSSSEENMGIHDEMVGDILRAPSILDNSYENSYSDRNHFGDYLSRPVLINTTTWTENTFLSLDLLPWYEYFNNTAIKKKIDNYNLMHCKLHLKVVINASPFYYGLGYAAYLPYTPANAGNIDTSYSVSAQNVLRSQRPNIEIWPGSNAGGEMELPFLYNRNWLDVTSALDLQEMGRLELRSYTPLRNANSVVGTGVTIRIYAWTSDLSITAPTSKLAVQSKSVKKGKKDEYGEGVVSKPAAAVAAAAAALGEVPVIGPFALATSYAAGAVSSIASIFGYTNTPVIDNVAPYKNLPFHSLSTTEIGQPTERLSYHPKNEVTIDNRVCGLTNDDEMLFSTIIGRPSYLGTVSWLDSQAPSTVIWWSRVNPALKYTESVASASAVFQTPMGHLGTLFYKWRGDLIFTIKIPASKFHRGRLRVTWDPTNDPTTPLTMPDSANTTNIVEIFDISEATIFEFRVPYMKQTEFLDTAPLDTDRRWDGTGPVVAQPFQDNGYLFIDVLTELTSPVATAPLDINVFVRGATHNDGPGQIVEFANPRDLPHTFSVYKTQSSDIIKSGAHSVEEHCEDRYKIYMGEPVTSLRQILHRSSYIMTATPPPETLSERLYYYSNFPRYPPYFGYDPSGKNTALQLIGAGSTNFNYVTNNPFNWMGPCYVGSRGSVTWDINPDNQSVLSTVRVVRDVDYQMVPADWSRNRAFACATQSEYNTAALQGFGTAGSSAQALTNARTQTGLSVNSPAYVQYRFLINNPLTRNYGTDKDASYRDSLLLQAKFRPLIENTDRADFDFYFRTGHDFSFVYFTNVPVIYSYGSLPNPA